MTRIQGPRAETAGAIAIYLTAIVICFRLRLQGSTQAPILALGLTVSNVSYCVLYFINEFHHDRIVSGKARVEDGVSVAKRRRYLTWYGVVAVNICQLFVFAFLFEQFYALGGQVFFTFERELTYFDWFLYTLDCTFKSVFDITEIFDLHLRNIQHHGWVGGLVVASTRLLIYSLLVTALVRQWSKRKLIGETVTALNNAPQMAGRRLLRLGEDALPRLQKALDKKSAFEPDHEDEVLVRDDRSGPLMDLLLRNLEVGTDTERLNASVVLGLLAPRDSTRSPYFLALEDVARGDPSTEVRVAAIDSLGRLDDTRTLPTLRQLIHDPEPKIRTQAVRVLGRRRDIGTVEHLKNISYNADTNFRIAAYRALGRIGDTNAMSALRRARRTERNHARREAIFSLAHLRDASVTQDLIEVFDDPDPEQRRKAVQSFRVLSAKGSLSALDRLLDDSDVNVRREATRTLATLDPRSAVHTFMKKARDPDAGVRRSQVDTFLHAKGEEADSFLEDASRDKDAGVRGRAIDVLAKRHSTTAVDVLMSILDRSDPEERRHALRALGENGSARAYPRVLTCAQQDPDAHVRRQAVRTLRQLCPQQASSDSRRFLEDVVVCGEAARSLAQAGS